METTVTTWLKPGIGAIRTIAFVTGVAVIALAITTHLWQLDLPQVYGVLDNAFGPFFLALYIALVGIAGCAIFRLKRVRDGHVWHELGVQASGGIATLALTFTLLGISLGIESLSHQELSPDTVNAIIGDLTHRFSTAFLTTIVGLPTANLLRAIISVRWRAMHPHYQEVL